MCVSCSSRVTQANAREGIFDGEQIPMEVWNPETGVGKVVDRAPFNTCLPSSYNEQARQRVEPSWGVGQGRSLKLFRAPHRARAWRDATGTGPLAQVQNILERIFGTAAGARGRIIRCVVVG